MIDILKFKNEKEADNFVEENNLFWDIWNTPEFPAKFLRINNILVSFEDAKTHYPQEYEEATKESPFEVRKPQWDGKNPVVSNVLIGGHEDHGDVVKDITAEIMVNQKKFSFGVGTVNHEQILSRFKKYFIRKILVTPENLAGVFKFMEDKKVTFDVDLYGKFDIRDSLNHGDTYSRGTDLNTAVLRFIKKNWFDEFYGFY